MAITLGEAYVAKSGTSVVVNFVDSSTLKDVSLAAGTGDATISINGGAPITLATKLIGQGIVFLASITGQTFTVVAGNTVTITAPSGWVTANSGADSSPALTAQALTNYTGTEHLTIVPPTGSLRMGWNLQKPSYFNPVPLYNNWARGANRFTNASSTYDSNGYPTAISGTTEAIVVQCNVGSEPWDGMPQSGNWRIYWDGASGNCTLANQGGNTTVTAGASSTGNATDNYREYSVTVNTLPGGLKYAVTAVPVSNIRIYPPGVTTASAKFRTDFLTQVGAARAIRFLDATDTNSSNVIAFSDFSASSVITYFRRQNQQVATVTQFEAWTNDGSFETADRIKLLVTTSAAHGFTTGMTVDFSGATAIACNSGAFTITPTNNYMVVVQSATTFAISHFRSGGGTVDAPVNPPSCTCLIDIAGTMPVADMVELCNLKSCDMWINVPHLASNACVTSLADYIAANLNSNLRCIVEYTNEHWNSATAFNQFRYCYLKGQFDATIAAATSNVYYRGNYWYAQRSTEVHDLFATAWASAGRAAANMVRLLATQFGNSQITTNVLFWAKTQLGKQVDAIAFAPYWGSNFVSADSTITALCSVDQLMEFAIGKSQNDARQDVTRYEAQLAVVTSHGLQGAMYIYETGADIFAAGAGAGSEKSRAVGRHPRIRYLWNWRLKKFESQGYTYGCVYLHGHHNLTSGGGGAQNTNWSVWLAHDQVAGLGDGSDGLFDNTSDYDNHGAVVSVQGYALSEWLTMTSPAAAVWYGDFSWASVAGSGSPPTAPTLAVSDNADGTGGVATISGGDSGATHTVQSQTVDGELGTSTWTTRGSRTGNGTVNVAPGNGYYWWRVVATTTGGGSVSNLVYQPLTSGTLALYDRILSGVQARIQSLALTGVASASVLVRKVPWDRDVGTGKTYAFPIIQVSPHGQESMNPQAGTNLKDDVGYAVLVSMMDLDNQHQTNLRERRLRWREAIIRTFRHARLPSISEVYDCVVEPNVVIHAPNWLDHNLWTSFVVLRFVARETRGFGT